MKLSFHFNKNQFTNYLREILDSHLQLGMERYPGWVLGPLFSISYYNGKELLTRNYPIYNKIMGICINNRNGCHIRYFMFSGLTDPVSFMIQYIAALLIFLVANTDHNLAFPEILLLPLLSPIFVSILTFFPSKFSETGKEGRQQLILYLEKFKRYDENNHF